MLVIGSEVSLWQPLLLDWLLWMRGALPDIALRVHVDVPQDLINQVAGGLVDVAVMYAPPHRPGLKIDLLLEEELVLVTTDPAARRPDSTDYVYVEWVPEFVRHHATSFPDIVPSLFISQGPLALDYVLAAGGVGYFRKRAVQPHLESGRLYVMPGMPEFSYPIYAVHSAAADDDVVGPALAGLRLVSGGRPISP